jgi:predicted DCC family thiol-disulfide oxidoreductase YuxK
MSEPSKLVMLFDGECEFCCRVAAWFRRQDPGYRVELIPFQEASAPFDALEIAADAQQRVQFISQEGARSQGGEAILLALRSIDWHPAIMNYALHRPMIWGVELGYVVVARVRRYL